MSNYANECDYQNIIKYIINYTVLTSPFQTHYKDNMLHVSKEKITLLIIRKIKNTLSGISSKG